jgi:hypothetical protein
VVNKVVTIGSVLKQACGEVTDKGAINSSKWHPKSVERVREGGGRALSEFCREGGEGFDGRAVVRVYWCDPGPRVER